MDREEFIRTKNARMEEISKVIQESGERIKQQRVQLEEMYEKINKSKKDHP